MKNPKLVDGTLIVLFILALYGRSLWFPFVLYDDDLHLYRNPILSASYWEALKYFWMHPYRGFYIPVTYSVWATLTEWVRPLDPTRSLNSMSSLPFHAASIAFHMLNTFLVYSILKKFLCRRWIVMLGALFFALHPVQVESVVWATDLKDLLSICFALIATNCVLVSRQDSGPKVSRYYLIYIICYLLSLLSKPGVIYLPILVMGLVSLKERRWVRELFGVIAFSFLAATPLVAITSGLQPLEKYSFNTSIWQRPLIATDAIFHYLGKLFLPISLAHDYGVLPELVVASPMNWVKVGIAISVAIWLFFKKRSCFWALALFCLTYSPVLGFVRFAFQDFSTVSDHYMYLSVFILALGLGYLLEKYQSTLGVGCAVLYILLLFTLSVPQVGYWRSSRSLLEHTLEVNPRSFLSRNNLAVSYEEEGNLERALSEYLLCLELRPNVSQAHYNVGNLLMKLDRFWEAEQSLIHAVELDANNSDALFNLGLLSEAGKRHSEAEEYFRRVVQVQPNSSKGYIKLAQQLKRRHRDEEALGLFEIATEVDPFSSQAHFHFGKELARQMGRTGRAKEELEFALRLSQGNPMVKQELEKLN